MLVSSVIKFHGATVGGGGWGGCGGGDLAGMIAMKLTET
jgi:hypothetical protein